MCFQLSETTGEKSHLWSGEKSHLERDATVGRFAEHHTTKSARRAVQHLERVQIVEHVIISNVNLSYAAVVVVRISVTEEKKR